MNDLIERQAAIEALKREEALTRVSGYHRVINAIRDLPSAQPEIIRCKDCKHYTLKPQVNSNYCYIRHCTRSALISSKPDDYCSWAERRTDDGE